MPQITTLFEHLEKEHPRNSANIAGYINDQNVFCYHVSSSNNLPAAVVVFDLVGYNKRKNGKVYTNLTKSHWVYTYVGSAEGGSAPDLVHVNESNASALEATPMTKGKGQVRVLAGEGGNPGPLTGGGLFQAAKSLHDSATPVSYLGAKDNHSRDKGLHRALRYYMLAAYALLGKCAGGESSVGNYIAALLVDDQGKILSYGINSGGFHHGETNMLLNYFRAHGNDPTFPANTIIFSTLTPCKQCSKYIEATRPGDSVVFIGQRDTGSRGREGEKYGVHLSAVTDPIRNRVAKPIMGTRETGEVRTIPGVWGKGPTTVKVTEQVQTGEDVKRSDLEEMLSKKMKEGDGTIAEQIGKYCTELLIQSRGTFTHKQTKARNQGVDDQLVKYQVLDYLNTWMNGVGANSDLKAIS